MAVARDDTYTAASGATVRGGRTTLPAWRRAMTVGTWAEVGSNTLSALDPAADPALNPNYPSSAPWRAVGGQSAVVTSWNGAAWDDSTLRLWIVGGGHDDYAGNETYRWDAETGLFVRVTNPTGAIGNTGTLDDGLESSAVYFDGQPRSFHTYNNLAVRNGALWLTGGAAYRSGGNGSRPFYFDEGQNKWVKDGDMAVTGYGSICHDTLRDQFFCFGTMSSPPGKYNPAAHTLTSHTKGWVPGGDNRSIYDPVRDVVLVAKDNNTIQIIDASGAAATVTMTISGTPPPDSGAWAKWGSMGLVYDDLQDRYLAWVGGADIYVLTPPSGDFRSQAWVWSKLAIDAANAVTPTAATSNGTFGRFWYSSRLNCVGVVNAIDQHMYVFALGQP